MQAKLSSLFTLHHLERGSKDDPLRKGELAAQLLDELTYANSKNLVLTFDSSPEEERETLNEDDLTCLGVRTPTCHLDILCNVLRVNG